LVWIYISVLLLIFIFAVYCRIRDIKVIRVFGFELISLLICSLLVLFIICEVFIPMPQYYIKHGGNKGLNLNEVLEEETLRAGIEFDKGSFKILDSYGMDFNHLVFCSYEIDGKEEVRFFHFEKNIFGNMKPKYPLKEIKIITSRNNQDDYYNSYIKDGIFAEYLVTVGFGADSSESKDFGLNKYTISKTPQKGYFMWVEMVREPWKSGLVKLILYAGVVFLVSRYQNKRIEPVRFYSKWKIGDKIFTCIKNVNP